MGSRVYRARFLLARAFDVGVIFAVSLETLRPFARVLKREKEGDRERTLQERDRERQ